MIIWISDLEKKSTLESWQLAKIFSSTRAAILNVQYLLAFNVLCNKMLLLMPNHDVLLTGNILVGCLIVGLGIVLHLIWITVLLILVFALGFTLGGFKSSA